MTFILSVAELALVFLESNVTEGNVHAISGQLCESPHSSVIYLGEKVFKAQFEQ